MQPLHSLQFVQFVGQIPFPFRTTTVRLLVFSRRVFVHRRHRRTRKEPSRLVPFPCSSVSSADQNPTPPVSVAAAPPHVFRGQAKRPSTGTKKTRAAHMGGAARA